MFYAVIIVLVLVAAAYGVSQALKSDKVKADIAKATSAAKSAEASLKSI